MVNLGGTQKVDFLGTCFGGDGSQLLGNDIFYGVKGSASRGSCKRRRPMVNLGGNQKVDFLGTCFGGDGLGHREKPIDSAQGRARSRLFGYLPWW